MSITSVELEDIPAFFATLPRESWLARLKTQHQIDLWHRTRRNQEIVAAMWRTYYTQEPDPIKPLVLAGEISNDAARLTRALVNTYISLWNLTVVAYPQLKRRLPVSEVFPFESALELFQQIIIEYIDDMLADATLPYLRLSPRSAEKSLRLFLKHDTGQTVTPIEFKKLERLAKELNTHKLKWQRVLLQYAEANKGCADKLLHIHYQTYRQTNEEMVKTLAAIAHRTIGVEWVKGILSPFRKNDNNS